MLMSREGKYTVVKFKFRRDEETDLEAFHEDRAPCVCADFPDLIQYHWGGGLGGGKPGTFVYVSFWAWTDGPDLRAPYILCKCSTAGLG